MVGKQTLRGLRVPAGQTLAAQGPGAEVTLLGPRERHLPVVQLQIPMLRSQLTQLVMIIVLVVTILRI